MKILFIINSKTLPSGIVRVSQYLDYLLNVGVEYEVLEAVSPSDIWLQRLQQHFLHGNQLAKKCLRHSVTKICNLIGWVHRRNIYSKAVKNARNFDAVFFQWLIPEETVVESLKKQNVPIIYDFDDAVFLLEPRKSENIIRNSALVVAGSHYNFEYAKQYSANVVIVPSSVPVDSYSVGEPADDKNFVRLGWIGSSSTLKYLEIIVEPLEKLAAQGYRLQLFIAGTWNNKRDLPVINGVQVKEVPDYSGEDIPRLVEEIDVGLMPIADTPWERGKCAMKALIYMAGARPVVSSCVGEIRYIVRNGENGYLAGTSQEWFDCLKTLLDNKELRKKIGLQGRETIEKEYSTSICFERLYEALCSTIASTSLK